MTESFDCPKCENPSRVKKLSAAYASSNDRRLAPPPRPRLLKEQTISERWEKVWPLISLYILICLGLAFLKIFQLISEFVCTAILIIFGVFLLYWTFRERQHDKSVQKIDLPFWEVRKETWEKLYYCELHDLVFNPQTSASAPASNYKELL